MSLTTTIETGTVGQSINLPFLCPDGKAHELVSLFCPHSHPHTEDSDKQVIAGWLCIHCDEMAMFDPWCLCDAS